MSFRRLRGKDEKERKDAAEPEPDNIPEYTVSGTASRFFRTLYQSVLPGGKKSEKKIKNNTNQVTADKSGTAAGRDVTTINNYNGAGGVQIFILLLFSIGLTFLIGYLVTMTKILENFHGLLE